jgi:hypothetical protein
MTNTYPETHSETILRAAAASSDTCSCADPIPVQRAERKGAALTVCQRCGLRVAARLR